MDCCPKSIFMIRGNNRVVVVRALIFTKALTMFQDNIRSITKSIKSYKNRPLPAIFGQFSSFQQLRVE